MFCRLRAPVRSLCVFHPKSRSYGSKAADALRILFCGSDDFSIAALRKLYEAHQADSTLIESIDVLHRPAKRTGRSRMLLREVPIKAVATEELKLQTHVIDTFTGWTPPLSYNLIIAVSFGLFVPPRILDLAKYKGLNVHPSLLPDLAGAAPLQHAILKRRPFTGVTVQTLHPEKFDGGTIIAQTPEERISLSGVSNLEDMIPFFGNMGGSLLVDVLKNRAFVPPLKDVGWYAHSGGPVEHAGKLEKRHWHVDFSKATSDDIITMMKAGGKPWTILPNGRRLLLTECSRSESTLKEKTAPGIWCPDPNYSSVIPSHAPKRRLKAVTADGSILNIESSHTEGGKKGGGYKDFKKAFGTKRVEHVH